MKYNDIIDNALDEMINEAANSVVEKDEEMSDDENILFSKEHEDRMDRFFKAERRKASIKKFIKYSKRAACVALACVAVLGISIFSVEAWRVRFLNFVLESNQPNTDYNFSETKGTTYSDDNFILEYVPMGFRATQASLTRKSATVVFESDSNYFFVEAHDINIDSNIDTEDATIEKMTMNGCEAILISNHNGNYLIWHDNIYAYCVIGDLSKEDTIKIAENMEFIGKFKKY